MLWRDCEGDALRALMRWPRADRTATRREAGELPNARARDRAVQLPSSYDAPVRAPTQVAVVWSASLASAIMAFAFSVVLARTMGAEAFGAFMTAFAVSRLAAPLAQGGVSEMWLQAFGRYGHAASGWIRPGLEAMAVTSGVAIIGMAVWASVGAPSGEVGEVAILLAVVVALGSVADNALAEPMLRGRFMRVALWQTAPYVVRLLAAGAAAWVAWTNVREGARGAALLLTLIVGTAATAVVGVVWLRSLRTNPPTDDSPHHEPMPPHATVVGALGKSIPFALQGVAYLLFLQIGTIALGSAGRVADAGHLSVAMNIVTAMHLFPSAVYLRVFAPRFFQWGNSDPKRLAATAPRVLGWVMLLSVAATAAAWLLLPWAIPLVFGADQEAAIAPARTLALGFPVWCLGTALAAHHTTPNEVRWRTVGWITMAVVTGVACVAAAPVGGLEGVVRALLGGQVVFAVVMLVGQLTLVGPRWRAAARV